jgi:hypothetical protein
MHHAATLMANTHALYYSLMTSHETMHHAATLKVLKTPPVGTIIEWAKRMLEREL